MEFLTRKVRLIILLFLILSFCVATPLILFYTAGYRYDFSKGEVKQTGVLSVDASPEDMNVFLNNVKIKNKMPIYLPNRAPGTYKIKLAKDGYKDWEKDITIESKKTTYIKEVTLFKEAEPVKILIDNKNPIQNIFISPSGNYILILSGEINKIIEITLYDTNSKKNNTIFRNIQTNWPKISWSPFDDYVLILTEKNLENEVQLFDPANPGLTIIKNFSTPIINWYWQKNSFTPAIYLQEKNSIILLNNNGQQTIDNNIGNVWYNDGQNNWIYDQEKQCLSYFGSTANERKCLINLPEKITKIIEADPNRLIAQTETGLISTSLENNIIKEIKKINASNFIFNRETQEWLVWSDFELWTIYINGTVTLLNRTGEKVKFVIPLDNYGLLLLASENKISGFNPGYYVTHDLLNNAKLNSVGTNIKNKKIFFFGEFNQEKGIFELNY